MPELRLFEVRLKTKLWIEAALRSVAGQGGFAQIVHRGDDSAGAVLIKQNFQNGDFRLLGRIGDALWRPLGGEQPAAEAVIDAAITRRRDVDRDLWVIEIEDKQGRLPLGEHLAEESASPPDDLFRPGRNFR